MSVGWGLPRFGVYAQTMGKTFEPWHWYAAPSLSATTDPPCMRCGQRQDHPNHRPTDPAVNSLVWWTERNT